MSVFYSIYSSLPSSSQLTHPHSVDVVVVVVSSSSLNEDEEKRVRVHKLQRNEDIRDHACMSGDLRSSYTRGNCFDRGRIRLPDLVKSGSPSSPCLLIFILFYRWQMTGTIMHLSSNRSVRCELGGLER